jgi:hypothetical protein
MKGRDFAAGLWGEVLPYLLPRCARSFHLEQHARGPLLK